MQHAKGSIYTRMQPAKGPGIQDRSHDNTLEVNPINNY